MKRANYAELLQRARGRAPKPINTGARETTTKKTTTKTPTTPKTTRTAKPHPAPRAEKTSKTMKRGKLTGKAKAAFLARMNRGRAAAGIAPIGKPSKARSASPKKPSSAHRRPKKPQTVRVNNARAGKPRPGGRGGGKHVPVKLDIQISEKERAARARGRGGGGKRGGGHGGHRPLYKNPMGGMELVVGGACVGLGVFISRFSDRYMATRPVIAALTPAAGTTPTTLSLNDAVNSAPGLARWGLQGALAVAPLVGSYWAPPMVRTALQGTALGVVGNMFTMFVEHIVLVKLLAPKTSAGALAPIANGGQLAAGQTAPSMIARLYNDEITADADKATVAATTGGAVSGLPRPRQLPPGVRRFHDPGPVARPRAGVGDCPPAGTAAPGSSAPGAAGPGCVIDPTCGVPAGAATDCPPAALAGAATANAGGESTVIAPPADQTTGTGLGDFGFDSWDAVVQNAA